ncbi:bifunctional diguanylate cyclase/phosphodiesterase [Vibrio sp. T187]|nr:GGDEF domain-containing phosphodiesterase [Vibrio sp. T187]
MQQLLEQLIESQSTSDLFIKSLQLLHDKYQPNHCFIADTSNKDLVAYTQCYFHEGKLAKNFAYRLHGTPCDIALSSQDEYCFFPAEIQSAYPQDQALIDLGAQAYIGLPLTARNGERVGLIVMLYDQDMSGLALDKKWLKLLGYIVGQELYQNKINLKNAQLVRQFRQVETLSDMGFFGWDLQKKAFEFSPNFWRVMGIESESIGSLEELLSKYIFKSEDQFLDYCSRLFANNDMPETEFISKRQSPINKYIKITCHNVKDQQGTVIYVEGTVQNITEHKELAHEFNIASEALNQSNDAILVTDKYNKIIQVNKRVEEFTGYTKAELVGKTPSILSSGLQSPDFYKEMWQSIEDSGAWEGELWNQNKNGTIYPERLAISTLKDESQDVSHYIAVFRDITRRKHNEQRIKEFEKYESVTGLTKRPIFIKDVESSLSQGKPLALALFDIKGFSLINQSYGDELGDKLLLSVANRLEMVLGDRYMACRYGSDEFAVALDVTTNEEVVARCEDIRRELMIGYQVAGHTITLEWSVGMSSFLTSANETNPMMQAKLALEQSKTVQGRPTLFTAELENQVARRLKLKVALEAAIQSDALEVHYQPIYNTETGLATKFEALARWKTESGYISPFEFISVAEEYNLIVPLGRCILEQACRDLKTLYQQGHTDVVFSINRSIKELNAIELQQNSIVAMLEKYGLPTSSIVIEITESISLDDNPIAKEVLDQLKNSGVKLAIDDFGTGYASFANLISQELDYLKVDRSFITNVSTDKSCMVLTQTAISLADKLELDVIAEGVETQCQLELLKSLGCKFVQGYFLGKPQAFEQIYRHLA